MNICVMSFFLYLATLSVPSFSNDEEYVCHSEPDRIVSVHVAQDEKAAGFYECISEKDRARHFIYEEPFITDEDVVAARLEIQPDGELIVHLKLTDDGTARMEREVARNVGKRLAFVIDGLLRDAPRIVDAFGLPDRWITLVIPGLTESEASRLKIEIERRWPDDM